MIIQFYQILLCFLFFSSRKSIISVPTMFMLTKRGLIPSYFKDLLMQLPVKQKRLEEIYGSVFWMLSNPIAAANIIANWINELKYTATNECLIPNTNSLNVQS